MGWAAKESSALALGQPFTRHTQDTQHRVCPALRHANPSTQTREKTAGIAPWAPAVVKRKTTAAVTQPGDIVLSARC